MSQVLDLTRAGHSLEEEMEWGTLAEEEDFVKEIIQLSTEFRAELREPSLLGYLYSSTSLVQKLKEGLAGSLFWKAQVKLKKKTYKNEGTCAGEDH